MYGTQGCTALGSASASHGSLPQSQHLLGHSPAHTQAPSLSHTHARAHTHSPSPASLGSTLAAGHLLLCQFSSRPDGGPAGRGLPGGSGREECAPTPRPIWPASRPICFPLPGAAHCGAASARPQGCEVYVAGPGAGGDRATHAHTDTHRTPPASPDVCSHTQSIPPSASQGTHVLTHQLTAKIPNPNTPETSSSYRVPQQRDTHAVHSQD